MNIGATILIVFTLVWVIFFTSVIISEHNTIQRRMMRANKRIRKDEARLELFKAKALYERNKR